MQVFLYESNKTIHDAMVNRLERAGAKCSPVDESFFHCETVKAVSSSITTAAILIGDDGSENTEEFVKSLRSNGCLSPIICLLSSGKDTQKTVSFINSGADDVLLLPVSGVEVIARTNAIIRRSYGHVASSVMIGDVQAYFDGRDPEVNGERIKLSGREHAIFTHLALQPGRVISKEQIYEAVYGLLDNQPYAKVIDVYICKLRKKLEDATGLKYIETVYGRGYKLSDPSRQKESTQQEFNPAVQGRNSAAFIGSVRNQKSVLPPAASMSETSWTQ